MNDRRYFRGSVGVLLGSAAASGALVGAILGLITRLRHRAIAAFMSLGTGVLLSAASFKVAYEALMQAGAASTAGKARFRAVLTMTNTEASH
jgi:hypothetical protein